MKILVTGRDGQVARSLAERGGAHELIFASRPDLDLSIPDTIERTIETVNPDIVISAAAYTAVDRAEDEPDLAMAINGSALYHIGRAAGATGASVIHLSTDYVFNGSGTRAWREDDPTGPINVYGKAKLTGEEELARSGATYAILRTAWVYSPFGSNFVKTMLRLAETRDMVKVVNDQFGNPTSALDIADALLAIANRWSEHPGLGADAVYHFAGAGTTDWASFARAIFTHSACNHGPVCNVTGIAAREYPTRAARPANSALDTNKFAEVFGHGAPDWQDSLAHTVTRLVT